ncbi:MAG: hypothetical protein ACPIOQ_76860, partial [Promethearchaeia archaeon]
MARSDDEASQYYCDSGSVGEHSDTTHQIWAKIPSHSPLSVCDASATIENGAVGDCTSTLSAGSSCAPVCDAGFELTGSRSCDASGTLSDTAKCAPTSPYSGAQYDVGTVATPILHYSFDDETFTNKVDNTEATCVGTCSFVDGVVGGKAFSTSQREGFLKLSPAPYSIVSAWSVCAWLKANRVDLGWQTALGYWPDGGLYLLHLGLQGWSGDFGEYSGATGNHNYAEAEAAFPPNTWKHVCILISG